jgi:protease IV
MFRRRFFVLFVPFVVKDGSPLHRRRISDSLWGTTRQFRGIPSGHRTLMKGTVMAQGIAGRMIGWRSARAVALGLLALSLAGCISVGAFPSQELQRVVVERSDRWVESNRIALVDVGGFIASESGLWTLLGGTSVADVQQKLQLAAGDSRVRAVVLRINSPGGEASASDTIYQEVLRFKEKTGKPVVAALMGTAASGGYYVALSADRIVATPTTITGSIGVIMNLINTERLYGKLGLQPVVIKSGEKKDIASSTRPMTSEEREILQGLNRALFDQFVAVVRERRQAMNEEQLKIVSDGRVMSAREALQLNLVDRVGYLRDAIQEARDLAKIESADVILYRPEAGYNSNIYAHAGTGLLLEEGLNMLLLRRGPTFLYLWAPGM